MGYGGGSRGGRDRGRGRGNLQCVGRDSRSVYGAAAGGLAAGAGGDAEQIGELRTDCHGRADEADDVGDRGGVILDQAAGAGMEGGGFRSRVLYEPRGQA